MITIKRRHLIQTSKLSDQYVIDTSYIILMIEVALLVTEVAETLLNTHNAQSRL